MTPTGQPQQRHTAEFISLRDYFDARLAAIDKQTECARITMEKRLDGMNEFRDALKDQNATFLTRSEYCVSHDSLVQDIRSLRESRAELSGKAEQGDLQKTTIASIIGIIFGLISLVLKLIEY